MSSTELTVNTEVEVVLVADIATEATLVIKGVVAQGALVVLGAEATIAQEGLIEEATKEDLAN